MNNNNNNNDVVMMTVPELLEALEVTREEAAPIVEAVEYTLNHITGLNPTLEAEELRAAFTKENGEPKPVAIIFCFALTSALKKVIHDGQE